MAQAHGRNAKLFVWDSAGTCRDLSGDHNNVTLDWTRDNPQVTTLGDDTHQRLAGIRDATLTGAIVWNSGTGAVDSVLSALMSASTITLVHFAPGASSTGCPLYSGCMLISALNVNSPVNGPVAANFTMQIASGSVTVGTVA